MAMTDADGRELLAVGTWRRQHDYLSVCSCDAAASLLWSSDAGMDWIVQHVRARHPAHVRALHDAIREGGTGDVHRLGSDVARRTAHFFAVLTSDWPGGEDVGDGEAAQKFAADMQRLLAVEHPRDAASREAAELIIRTLGASASRREGS